MTHKQLILASTSAIRRKLLHGAGVSFEVQSAAVDEDAIKRTSPSLASADLAMMLAKAKALSLSSERNIVIGADQTLSCNGKSYSKAPDLIQARTQLRELRGQTHVLSSAVAIADNGQIIWSHLDQARLTMRQFSDAFLDGYLDKSLLSSVGCYKLEERGIQIFEKIEGDYFTILGLPLLPLLAFLRERGILAA